MSPFSNTHSVSTHRPGLHISGEEPKTMVWNPTQQKNVCNSGSTTAVGLPHHTMQSMVISLPLSLSDTHRHAHTHMLNTIIFLLHIKSSASFNPEHKCVHSHSRNLSFNLLGYDSLQCAVERGLMELRKLGIENQLWQASRRGLEVDSNSKANLESDF